MHARHLFRPKYSAILWGAFTVFSFFAHTGQIQAQADSEELFLFALFWNQSDIGPDQFDYFAPDLLCTLEGLCNPSGPGGSGNAGIFGRVFSDLDRDGMYGEMDEPLNGIPVMLYNTSGARVATTVSADVDLDDSGGIDPETETGLYAFPNIPAGSYFVGEMPPLAFARTTQDGSMTIEVDKTAVGLVADDLDEDGDDDLVVNRSGTSGGSQRGLTVLFNEGSGVFTSYKPSFGSSADRSQTDPAVADFDLDGLKDLGVGTGSTYYTLSQTAGGSFIGGSQTESLGSSISQIETADVNGDDLPDVVGRFGIDDQVFVMLNLGLEAVDMWLGFDEPTILSATDIESFDVGDINGDTFPDIVTGTGQIFTNDGNGNFTATMDPGLASISTSANHTGLFDIDGDTDLDIVLVNGGFKGVANFTVEIAENDGNGNFTPTQSFFSIRPAGAEPIDLENDGDLDLAVRINVNGDDIDADYLQYLINDGDGEFTLSSGLFVTGEDALSGLAAADLNGEPGDELAFTQGFTGFGNPEFVRILDDPMGKIPVEALSGQQVSGPDFGNAFSAAAIEGQKFEDLNFNAVRDPGERGHNGIVIEAFTSNFGTNLRARTVTQAMDLNGDNIVDPETEHGWYRLVFEPDGRSENAIFEVIPEGFSQTLPNTPRPIATESQHVSFVPDLPDTVQEGDFETHQILAVDLTKDGAADYLYSGEYDPDGSGNPSRNVIQVLLNDGEGLFNDPEDPFLSLVAMVKHEFETGDRVTGLAAGDFDGDTNIDFAALEANSADLLLFKGDGAGTFTENGTVGRGQQAGSGILLSGDLDNDAATDLIAVNEGAVKALLNDGAGNFSPHATDFGAGSLGAPNDGVLTDLNGDGFPDLATSQQHSTDDGLFVMLNLGVDGGNVWQGFGPAAIVSYELDFNDYGPVAAANFDADPDVELVGGKSDGEVVIMDNDGSGVFSIVRTATAGLDDADDLDFIDDNMDGLLDIVVMGDEDGSDTVHENGRILRGNGQGNFTLADPFFTFLSNRIQVEEFNRDGIPDIGFHSDRSQAIGFYEFLQPRHIIEADIGDTVTGVNFGNFPIPPKKVVTSE